MMKAMPMRSILPPLLKATTANEGTATLATTAEGMAAMQALVKAFSMRR